MSPPFPKHTEREKIETVFARGDDGRGGAKKGGISFILSLFSGETKVMQNCFLGGILFPFLLDPPLNRPFSAADVIKRA